MGVATSKKHGKKNTSGKVLASVALVAAAAGVAGLGTYGSFTSTTSASASVTAGTVKVELGQPGAANRFSVAATGLVPGDTIQRAVTLSNTGNQNLGSLSLTTSAPLTSSKLDTDATNGLQLSIDSCSTGWTEAGTAPAYTYTCNGDGIVKTVLARAEGRRRQRRADQRRLAHQRWHRQPARQPRLPDRRGQHLPGPVQRHQLRLHRHPARRHQPLTPSGAQTQR